MNENKNTRRRRGPAPLLGVVSPRKRGRDTSERMIGVIMLAWVLFVIAMLALTGWLLWALFTYGPTLLDRLVG